MAKRAHRAVDPLQGQRKHALLDQAPDHADTDGPLPVRLGNRVEPDRTGIGREQAGEPYRARLVVPALDAAPFLLDLVGAHAGVADQHEAPALVIGAQQLEDRQRRLAAAARVAPYPIVHAIVKVEMDQMLELGTGGREQLFAKPDVILHRSADIEQQQQLYGICRSGTSRRSSQPALCAVARTVPAISSSRAAPARAKRRRRLRASCILRVPSVRPSSRLRNSRRSHALTALRWPPSSRPTRTPCGL